MFADGTHPEFPTAAAEAALAEGRHDLLLAIVERALENDPDDLKALQYRALAELELEREGPFLEAADAAVARAQDPSAPLALKSAGLTAFGQYGEARTVAEAAIDQAPGYAPAWDVLAQALVGEEDPDEALVAAEQAVKLAPENAAFLTTLGRAALARRDYPRALEVWDQVIALDAANSNALAFKAAALAKMGRTDEAIAAADSAHEIAPDSATVLRARAGVLLLDADVERAEVAMQEWIAAEPTAADAWGGMGVIYGQLERPEESLIALRKAVELAPEDMDYKVWLGAVLFELGENSDALALFAEVCGTAPDNGEAWIGRCAAERALGLLDEAVESARQSLVLQSFKDPEGWLELARSYSAAGRHENSWRAFSEAAKLDPNSADAALGVAVESIFSQNETRALSELRAAEERVGRNGLIEFNRGVAYYRLGDASNAREAWKRADSLDPALGASELIGGDAAEPELGGWLDHWFSAGGTWRKVGGCLLVLCLVFFLFVPILSSDLLPGLTTGELTIEAYVPALLLGFLIVLPAIRGLAVGPVSMDVAPKVAESPGLPVDPTRILPLFSA